jgi:hypothetical protein
MARMARFTYDDIVYLADPVLDAAVHVEVLAY